MDIKLRVLVMSGVEDGTVLEYHAARGDGTVTGHKWTITIGRRDENDICLRNDTYISRHHANLFWDNNAWHLEDCDSTNGTFINNVLDFFDDQPVSGVVRLEKGQLFRVGRTWLRIQD
ncbi:MAG: hypothetical protein OHK0046_06840 [Anaerolineae bacterium]